MALMDGAEDLVRLLQDSGAGRPRNLGAGICGDLLQFSSTCGRRRARISACRRILVELGRKMVGVQEDMIVDVALDMIKERDAQ